MIDTCPLHLTLLCILTMSEGRWLTVITRAHCLPFVGQRVVVRTKDGATHHGILHSVSHDGIYMRPIGARGARLVSEAGDNPIADILLNQPQSVDDVQEAWFPFFFFPFFAIAALWPWAWWW